MSEAERDRGADTQEASFQRYVLPEVEVLLRVASSLVRQQADAEDLVQETLLRAYRAIDSFDGAYPRAWLLTILRNAAANRYRRRRPDLLDDPDADLDRLSAGGDPFGHPGERGLATDPADVLDAGSLDATVVRAVRSLSPKLRSVLVAVDVDGLTYEEAAQLLDVPIGTVTSRLHRARAKVRAQLPSSRTGGNQ